jgi:hypothetical protein
MSYLDGRVTQEQLDAMEPESREAILELDRLAEERKKPRVQIGYWLTPSEEGVRKQAQEVIDCIVPGFADTDEGTACIEYMKAGKAINHYFGFARNRVTGKRLGTQDMSTLDDKYQFPELWWKYIDELSVKPKDKQFIKDAVTWWKAKLRQDYYDRRKALQGE